MLAFQSVIKVLESFTDGIKNEEIFKVAKFDWNNERRKVLCEANFRVVCVFVCVCAVHVLSIFFIEI